MVKVNVATVRVKDLFFDRALVAGMMTKGKKKALSRCGAFVRKRARSILRRRKKPSSPGSPPSVHSKDSNATLKKILFAYDQSRDSVFVGPVKLNGSRSFSQKTVPELHEEGGSVSIREWILAAPAKSQRWIRRLLSDPKNANRFFALRRYTTTWTRGQPPKFSGKVGPFALQSFAVDYRTTVARYPQRPFMSTALKLEQADLEGAFKDILTGAR